jgi:hypothetical protein
MATRLTLADVSVRLVRASDALAECELDLAQAALEAAEDDLSAFAGKAARAEADRARLVGRFEELEQAVGRLEAQLRSSQVRRPDGRGAGCAGKSPRATGMAT